ncbi:MAG: response regulator [Butyricicoccaceae bacterium]
MADDDMIVRLFLKDVMPWQEYGFEVVGLARDGEEALELSRTLAPDLILTDISMPRMDGVELTRCLREEGYDGTIVALSCHEDFAMVKDAMKYGADEYLLKNHLNGEAPGEMMQVLRFKLQERRSTRSRREQLQSLAQVGRKSLRRDFLQKILVGSPEPEELEELLQEAGLQGKFRRCAVLMFQPLDADDGQRQSFFEFCDQQVQERKLEGTVLTHQVYVVLVDLTEIASASSSMELLGSIQHTIAHFAEQYLAIELVSAQSAVHHGANALPRALRQAYPLLQYGFYTGGLFVSGRTPELSEQLPEEAERFLQSLPALLRSDAGKELSQQFEQSLSAIAEKQVRPGVVLQWLRRCDQTAMVIRDEHFYAGLERLDQYRGCCEDYEQRRKEIQEEAIPEQLSSAVHASILFIRGHCTEPIGLGHVARHVGLTPSYLSALFKREVGIGFSEFLLRERLKRVCAQLQTSKDTIAAISQRNGFPDYQHFCKTFKKHLGVTPAAYRRGER